MRVLLLNWRDIKNPSAGGAEVYIHEIAKRLVRGGHQATIFTAKFGGCKEKERIDGVDIVRRGGRCSVYWEAYKAYRNEFKGEVDLVIDSINTIPFFTPFYVKEKRMIFFYQLAKEFWFKSMRFPLSLIGYLAEPWYLRLYKKEKAITISESSALDLKDLGFGDVPIVYPGIRCKPAAEIPRKEKNLTLISFSRLVKPKRVDHVIKAFKIVNDEIPDSRLWILSGGPERKNLEGLARKLSLENKVKFFGYVPEKKKYELIRKAHVHLFCSVREGWGIVVVEAAANGTPTVGYDAAGTRDSVAATGGFLVDDYKAMAEKVLSLGDGYKNIASRCIKKSKVFDWERSYRKFVRDVES
ncbi:MAG: glycosyltransferase family 1 protein [Candidatus Aenigmarchaeota archaeon CG_4_9_14_3_um_filter_37_18]|nr:MAG: hypothetical protein AUJ50_01930 [Candidatus Aenigmarchaeota archaeon CG1_02_38_14]PIX50770.1 MAG: glycosyltransferase family 1 protein [Candidatus Aenigmarchaeota archaeon CG_4_8_14_3_um_filter_37_24]PJB75715.1 MAG: glycosyltransferase family 1 protein [Candidatus Aenigmarchaeota archaeon CG_4_9_14_3_um_filter_37_18]